MNDTYELRSGETHIEVHKFYPGAVVFVAAAALIFQAMAPVYFPKLNILDLPLLVTIYFGLSRRNPSTGLLLGMVIGLAQDALSGPTVPLGFYGMGKTVIGYLASSIGARLDTEHPGGAIRADLQFFCGAPGGAGGGAAVAVGAAGGVDECAPGDCGGGECTAGYGAVFGVGPVEKVVVGLVSKEIAWPERGRVQSALPDPTDSIVIERSIVANYRQAFSLTLGNEHPIEGILVRAWE